MLIWSVARRYNEDAGLCFIPRYLILLWSAIHCQGPYLVRSGHLSNGEKNLHSIGIFTVIDGGVLRDICVMWFCVIFCVGVILLAGWLEMSWAQTVDLQSTHQIKGQCQGSWSADHLSIDQAYAHCNWQVQIPKMAQTKLSDVVQVFLVQTTTMKDKALLGLFLRGAHSDELILDRT